MNDLLALAFAVVQARNYMLLLAYFNSTLITVGAVTLLVIFSAMIGYALQRRPSDWNKVIYGFVLAGLMIPPAVVPTIWVLQSLGLFKTITGMILIQVAYGMSFSVLLYRSFISTIPRDLDESARLDGASSWVIFTKILLPLVRPGIGLTALFSFMSAYNEFIMASVFLDDVTRYTLPVTLQQSVGGFDPNWGMFAAGSLVLSVPVVAVFFFVQKQMVEGMTAGAVKG